MCYLAALCLFLIWDFGNASLLLSAAPVYLFYLQLA